MPTIPRANPDGLSPTAPLPGVRVSTNAPAGAFGGQPQSVDLSGVERATAQIVEQERAKADQIAALDADNKLADLETSLLYDQKTGILNRKGQNAFTAPEEVSTAWRKGTAEIEKGLSTDRQLALFQAHAQGRFQNVFTTVQRHVAGERQQYDNETANAAIANRYDAAIRSNGEPHAVESALLETQAIIGDYAKRNGWSPEVAAEKKATAVSRIHAGIVESMLSGGRDLDAKAYYDDNIDEIGAAERAPLARALEQGTTDGAGLRAATDVWTKLGPKGGNDPVKVYAMEQALRESLGDDPKVLRAAIAEVRSRAQAFNAEQGETTAANKAKLLGLFNDGSLTLAQVKTRSEYRALSGAEQEQLTSYLENRSEQDLTRKNFVTFWSMSNPESLSKISEQGILASEPTLGRTLTGQLMQMKRALSTKADAADARVLSATIDDDLFKTVATDAGLNPYATGQSDDDKETLGRLKVAVENAIAREQDRIDKPLTQDQKRDVMQKIVDQKVLHDGWGTSTPSQIAATVKRDDRGRLPSDIFVPIEKVPADYQAKSLNWLRSIGAIRDGVDDKKALRQMGDRIGRAYAARIAGGTTAEIQAILQGKK